MLSRLLLWLCFISLTPAGPEAAEWMTHYAQEGDFADAPDHTQVPSGSEHGCAVLCHACGCHGPSTAAGLAIQPAERSNLAPLVRWPLCSQLVPQSLPEPLVPPPIA